MNRLRSVLVLHILKKILKRSKHCMLPVFARYIIIIRHFWWKIGRIRLKILLVDQLNSNRFIGNRVGFYLTFLAFTLNWVYMRDIDGESPSIKCMKWKLPQKNSETLNTIKMWHRFLPCHLIFAMFYWYHSGSSSIKI